MIIELFGPPGVGKTTLAHALKRRLQESGHFVDLTLSNRPAEHGSSPSHCKSALAAHRVAAVPRRLSRPLLELLAIVCHPSSISHDIAAAAGLLKILPPGNIAAAIKLSQYILRLSHCWYRASAAAHIVVFDQAFVQVICSLVLLGRSVDESLIARALDSTPRSDLLIRLDAPLHIVAARLQDRERRQSAIERLFEQGPDRNLKSIGIIDQLDRLLRDRGEPVIRATSVDRISLRRSVDVVEAAIIARLGAGGGDRASQLHEQDRQMQEAGRYARSRVR